MKSLVKSLSSVFFVSFRLQQNAGVYIISRGPPCVILYCNQRMVFNSLCKVHLYAATIFFVLLRVDQLYSLMCWHVNM